MFAAVISWALYTIIGRKVLGGLTPLAATNYAALWGTLLLACVACAEFSALTHGAVRLEHDRRAAVLSASAAPRSHSSGTTCR